MNPSKDTSRLVEIMAALRTPETGCPWDLEQDFRSIAPYTIEETYEVIDAIEREDRDNLREELGDLLLQVVYHARMAEEEGSFTYSDVVEGITEKMIRRHPHVFGDAVARTAGMAKGAWERIKEVEKKQRLERRRELGYDDDTMQTSLLDSVPRAMPGMMQSLKLQQKASKVGFDWNDPKAVASKIREELEEAEQEMALGDQQRTEEEIGDILFAVINLARHADVDPDTALRRTNTKFRHRFQYIEDNISRFDSTMEAATLEIMEDLWSEAKKT